MSKAASILDKYPHYEAVIGIEVHLQLTETKSKMFCSCANEVCKDPNINICEICAGYPGSLPVLNKQAVDYAILAGLATNCNITQRCSFARKHYFYPDLPKGYQITQHTDPICSDGIIPIRLEDNSIKNIRLQRIHMEEDTGKSIHGSDNKESFVDLNRAGTPLLEIVTHPDISNPYQAKTYLKALHSIAQYLCISTANMDEGAFRADTNISVRKKGSEKLGTRCELKNINSFKYISDAIEHEVERQITLLEQGKKVIQETRLWDTKTKKTHIMRSKEEAADYRYFSEPDLPILEINEEWIERVKKQLPTLPHEKFEQLVKMGLSPYEAEILVDDSALVTYFEKTQEHNQSKQIINWILRDVLGYLKEHNISIIDFKVTPKKLAALVELHEKDVINAPAAKEIFEIVAMTGQEPADVVKEKGFEQIGTADKLEPVIKKVLKDNPKEVERYNAGEKKLFAFFIGQVMKQTKGKGNPKLIQEILKKHL